MFFGSEFMNALLQVNPRGSMEVSMDRYSFENACHFHRGEDVFEMEKILFNINTGGSHWILACVFVQGRRIQIYDSMHSPNEQGGQGKRDHCHNVYLQALARFMEDRSEEANNTSRWTLCGNTETTPQQGNGYDCGVFVCRFAQCLLADTDIDFSQEDITEYRQGMRECLLDALREE